MSKSMLNEWKQVANELSLVHFQFKPVLVVWYLDRTTLKILHFYPLFESK